MMEARCARCGSSLGGIAARPAKICLLALGDEYTESYFYCPACGEYTVRVDHDRFMGDEETHFRGPLSREEGDRLLAMIAACPDPTDKFCACETHRALGG